MEQNYPQKEGIDTILKTAFYYWNKTLPYQLLFSLMYISLLITFFFFAIDYYELSDDFANYIQAASKPGMQDDMAAATQLNANINFGSFKLAILGMLSFLFPLNMGLYKMFRKIDLKEKIEMEDFFAGYYGVNFFIYASYFLFWSIAYSYASATIILVIPWIFLTLFTAPLMFFMDIRIIESFSFNVKAIKLYPLEIIICVFIAFLFKYAGLMVFLVGFLFTFPFMNAMIYALYRKIFSEKG